ncbi:MAG: glycosyltransferase [Thermodesulfobacteriota bacterium]|nr:glycosyltransferase [Thermodesulfobacteriota bacterium]
MRIAMLSPVTWHTPRRCYGMCDSAVSLLTEGLIKRNVEVSLFSSEDTKAGESQVAYYSQGHEEVAVTIPKEWECLRISQLFERGDAFDIIHNHIGYLPLTYSGMTSTPVVTTIHDFLLPENLPLYEYYNGRVYYVSVSDAHRIPELTYISTIHYGIEMSQFALRPEKGDYLLFLGDICHSKGAREAVEISQKFGMKLIIAGIIEDEDYFKHFVAPHLDKENVVYMGSIDPEKKSELMGKAYALVYPTNFNEPFCVSAVEAMACGTPVVAFHQGSMAEVISHRQTGFLVSSVDEAVCVLTRVKELDRKKCRDWVEGKFSVDRMVEDYLRLYQKILTERKREDHRPWGYYRVLAEETNHKVKKIVVYPGQRLSLQRHHRRAEHWYVIAGQALVTRDNEEVFLVSGQAVDLPCGAWHRIMNPGNELMIFIEVQTGDYFGEDDIERVEDDYGRI